MAASIVHIPLSPMTLEINSVSSEYVTWVYRWRNVDLSADFETYSQNFGHPDGWVWRMLFQQNVDANGNRVYGIFLYVVMTDNELQERTWTRDIRYLQFVILNSEGRQLKDKSTVAVYRENQLSWGFPGLLDNSILLRDPVVNSRRTIDIVCRLRYHPDGEKMRRPLSPSMTGSLLGGSMIGANHAAARAASTPASYWDQKASGVAVVDPVGKNLRTLINNRKFSDLELVVGPNKQIVHGHKAILATRSEWFEAALRPGFRESREGRITLPDEDPKIFEALLEFLYTGEYPLASIENHGIPGSPMITTKKSSSPDGLHLSPRSPPNIPPRGLDDSASTVGSSFTDAQPPTEDSYEYMNTYDNVDMMDEDEELDEQKYALFLMADKFGIAQLKSLIRVHLTNELLDLSSSSPPGSRLLRLIRFAFEELPESTTSKKRDSGMGSSVGSNGMIDRERSPSGGYTHGYVYGGGSGSGYPPSDLTGVAGSVVEKREGATSAFGHTSEVGDGLAMIERRSNSRLSNVSSITGSAYRGGNSYARDNETAILRENITTYVAKMFHAVRVLDGFDEMLREGGEMGGFARKVMDSMFRP
ncbi:uncharacterized protein LAJ45_02874 [Morchella importuna]|uniref:BTB domain-containing protein n=1 Tax=Morchella conica CCBAS932 TaxID=1392247 RepID=A0A3N4KY00_9PEZI|nr:uncharacterized protein LAJ45_02874 [Morchella importuna]KAH8153287.1 hypothetical protein LAJ45_02874 [Morchella importuna]RPB15444.1 hypothetical protein P167DRAFT_431632 [Morchella conica CCBAS932]